MAKFTGYGVVFSITIATVLTAVAQVKEIEYPEQEAETVDVTTHDSTSGYAEHIKTGLKRLNAFTLTLVFSSAAATHIAILAGFASTTAVVMKITGAADPEMITFSGLITKVTRTSAQNGAFEAKVTIQPTGVPTIA